MMKGSMATESPSVEFPVPAVEVISTLTDSHARVEYAPMHQQRLAFQIILPKLWVHEKDLGTQQDGIGDLVKIGIFAQNIPRDPAVVQVFCCRMPIEVGLMDWLRWQCEMFQTQILLARQLDLPMGKAFDIGGLYGPVAQQTVVRLTAFADDARIFLISSMVRRGRYPEHRDSVAYANCFFSLTSPTNSTLLEQWLRGMGHTPDFEVAHPASWDFREVLPKVPGKSAVDIFLAKEEVMVSYVRVKASSHEAAPASNEQRLKQATQELSDAKVLMRGQWLEDPDPSVRQIVDLIGCYTAEGRFQESACELRFGLVRRDGLEFAVTAITPPRRASVPIWLRSKRAYEIALTTASAL